MKYMIMAVVIMILAMLIFAGGFWLGVRENADPVSNSAINEKVEQEARGIHFRLDNVDAKLDILLNIATNVPNRELRPGR